MKEYRKDTGAGRGDRRRRKRPVRPGPAPGPIPADCIHVFVYPDPGIVYRYPLYTGIQVCNAPAPGTLVR